MSKINLKEVYEGRLVEIDKKIRSMARAKNWTGYGKLKAEKERLKLKLDEMRDRNE